MNNLNIKVSKYEPENTLREKRRVSNEYHVIVQVKNAEENVRNQIRDVMKFLKGLPLEYNARPLFVRYFLSDAANQQELLLASHRNLQWDAACSVIQQPPLGGGKIAVWVYLASDFEVRSISMRDGSFSTVEALHNGYTHYWRTSGELTEGDSFEQTQSLMESENEFHRVCHTTMLDNCIRTWFFLQNIDVNYQGMVESRNQHFAHNGLSPQTHFLTSTGICGRMSAPASIVRLDTYNIKGTEAGQTRYLYAKSHLNPTYEYGVAFERGGVVEYADRKHLFLSGTASINNKGEIMYEGDIRRQTERMLENCEALLQEGGATMQDLRHLLVYLRDVSDYQVVDRLLEDRLPNVPRVVLLAPVCRQGWLIEAEGMAVVPNQNNKYRPF